MSPTHVVLAATIGVAYALLTGVPTSIGVQAVALSARLPIEAVQFWGFALGMSVGLVFYITGVHGALYVLGR